MSRPSTGYVQFRNGKWYGRVRCVDGSRVWLGEPLGDWPNSPEGKKRAQETCAHWNEIARAKGVVGVSRARATKQALRDAPTGAETVDAFSKRWLVERARRGLSGVEHDRGRLVKHVMPTIGARPVAELSTDELRGLVEVLDAKVRADRLHWNTAKKVWGLVTKLFADACKSKVSSLRVRTDNPTKDVQGPDQGDDKAKQWLYPSEVSALLACPKVPLRYRRLYALSVYLYTRPGELAALEWSSVNFEHEYVHVHQALDIRAGKVKATKTGITRKVPIHPHLKPLLMAMHAEAGGKGRVVQHQHGNKKAAHGMPPLEDLAANLRVHLQRAEVKRADLYSDDRTTKRVTFYDLRATGITWEMIAGTEKARVQQRAGHLHSTTTDGYIRTAEELGVAVGVPFPALPAALYQPAKRKFISPRLAHRLRRSRHPRAESRQFSCGSGASGSVPKGIRTPVTALKGPCPGPG